MPYGTASFFGRREYFLKIRNHKTSREPSPPTSRESTPTDYSHVGIGDVGFIRRGQFHLLFSAVSPVGDVPSASEPLKIGKTTFRGPRDPGCLRTDTVRGIGAGIGATVPTPLYVPSLRPVSSYPKKIRTTQAPATWCTFLIRTNRESRRSTNDEAPNVYRGCSVGVRV